jgi:hypothetical protein
MIKMLIDKMTGSNNKSRLHLAFGRIGNQAIRTRKSQHMSRFRLVDFKILMWKMSCPFLRLSLARTRSQKMK